ncbi:hypothetical protein [Bdellovibrio sp. HCB274]|uniref:hypothetical protein n=1 Tax=Bdellovibrio sp. HCB274 TaxID=3394361 RepID=UPI0039B66F23
MAYRNEKSPSRESSHLQIVRSLGHKIRELALSSELAAQSSYFWALHSINHANQAKAIAQKLKIK